jgi:hypothetical protein
MIRGSCLCGSLVPRREPDPGLLAVPAGSPVSPVSSSDDEFPRRIFQHLLVDQ